MCYPPYSKLYILCFVNFDFFVALISMRFKDDSKMYIRKYNAFLYSLWMFMEILQSA